MNDEALTFLRRKVAESNQDLAILYLIHQVSSLDFFVKST